MSYKNVIWGLILIGIGIGILLRNLGILTIHWSYIFKLWPIVFVFWGISILPVKDWIKAFLSLVTLAGMLLFLVHLANSAPVLAPCIRQSKHEVSGLQKSMRLSEPMDSAITQVRLKLRAGTGKYHLRSGTDELFSLTNSNERAVFSAVSRRHDDHSIDVSLDTHFSFPEALDNVMIIRLNAKPTWELDFSAGAATIDADLQEIKMSTLRLHGGACELTLRLGMPEDTTYINIDAGVSSITFYLPEELKCQINTKSIFTDKSFQGFERVEKGVWKSEPENAPKDRTIFINIQSAVSTVNVLRY